MELTEVKAAVEAGLTVHWENDSYRVVKDNLGQWFIRCDANDHATGLTWRDGVTMNGQPEQFYVKEPAGPAETGQEGLEREGEQ